ncbi:MAG TPA: OsmC family protein [Gemmatimonadaceae bacterium]
MSTAVHTYTARLVWEGNTGEGTRSYTSYSRRYRVRMPGKPELAGSSDPAFRGDAELYNPEDLFLAAVSACHMLSYLALCARQRVRVLAYEDHAEGAMTVYAGGGGRFTEITLHPCVTVDGDEQIELATRLHDAAHERCFIANSCRVPIRHDALVRAEASASPVRDAVHTRIESRRA